MMPPNMLSGRMGQTFGHPVLSDDGQLLKPFRRNATHVAIAYLISTDKLN